MTIAGTGKCTARGLTGRKKIGLRSVEKLEIETEGKDD
jgi:hypothetical protein